MLNVVSGYIVRLVFVTMFGVAIGFFTTSENVIANPVSSLGAPALAFLAGYEVEAVFRMLDGLADQFFPRGSEVVSTNEAGRKKGQTGPETVLRAAV